MTLVDYKLKPARLDLQEKLSITDSIILRCAEELELQRNYLFKSVLRSTDRKNFEAKIRKLILSISQSAYKHILTGT